MNPQEPLRATRIDTDLHGRAVPRPPGQDLYEPRSTRTRVGGKFLFRDGRKLYVRGVTYGAFAPDADGIEYSDAGRIDNDFRQMAASGINAVRIPHTMPPRRLLDVAERHGLVVMVGLSAEQYVGYLADRREAPDMDDVVAAKVREVAGHPALLCYALGNEIPAALVRWTGRRQVERYLERLYRVVKREDPEGLVTYVNYPTTEYLDLPFLDLVAFNVYLEAQDRFEAYLARLQNVAGDRPLLMSELGLDALRNGEDRQAEALEWQIRSAFVGGCAGAFVFSWTDEWYRAGEQVEDWAFGVTDRERRPKAALKAVGRAFSDVPIATAVARPRVSVIVCSYNGARTLRECLDALDALRYRDYEVIVVDDGSTDATAAIASSYSRVRVIRTENRGLSSARNTGWRAAKGEIVAYLDDDAYPDPDWLDYLAMTFSTTDHAAVGGPNIPPAGDGRIAAAVAKSPGGPIHVLLSDDVAEHVPGCNMAFRRDALEAIGGFDEEFRVAGDDVDVCWRVQERGWTIGFNHAAMVWHHRRNSIRTYWRQQKGYGRAEALLERKWPAKYNAAGHVSWGGRVYGNGRRTESRRGRLYQGMWGMAPFQRLYQPAAGMFRSIPTMPEWHLIVALLAAVTALGVAWRPLLLASPFLAGALIMTAARAVGAARRVRLSGRPRAGTLQIRLLIALLHLLQPMARLWGRLQHGLTPWRRRGLARFSVPRTKSNAVWREAGADPPRYVHETERIVHEAGAVVERGGDFDGWDLEVRGGSLAGARLLIAVEDHGGGSQYVRYRVWPRMSTWIFGAAAAVGGFAVTAFGDGAVAAATVLSGIALGLVAASVYEAGAACRRLFEAARRAVAGDET